MSSVSWNGCLLNTAKVTSGFWQQNSIRTCLVLGFGCISILQNPFFWFLHRIMIPIKQLLFQIRLKYEEKSGQEKSITPSHQLPNHFPPQCLVNLQANLYDPIVNGFPYNVHAYRPDTQDPSQSCLSQSWVLISCKKKIKPPGNWG